VVKIFYRKGEEDDGGATADTEEGAGEEVKVRNKRKGK
jgi:hypothetical protein